MPLAPSLTGVLFMDYGDAWGAPEPYRWTPQMDADGHFIPGPDGRPLLQPLVANSATDKSFVQNEGFQGFLGYGVGIRVQTPLGPIRLDYGFGSEGSRAHFSLAHVF